MSRDFINIVEARVEEIIENVWFQVPNEYVDKLLGGIILTGGGSNMRNIERAFRNHTHIEKIRVAHFVTSTIHASQPEVSAHNGMMNTVLGLLVKGDMNCAGDEFTGDLFGGGAPTAEGQAEAQHKNVRSLNEISGRGIVQTEEEKKIAEEEARRKKEAEEEEQRRKEAEEAERIKREKRENSFWNKFLRGAKKFGKDIMDPDE